jgi:hypothetical protein
MSLIVKTLLYGAFCTLIFALRILQIEQAFSDRIWIFTSLVLAAASMAGALSFVVLLLLKRHTVLWRVFFALPLLAGTTLCCFAFAFFVHFRLINGQFDPDEFSHGGIIHIILGVIIDTMGFIVVLGAPYFMPWPWPLMVLIGVGLAAWPSPRE